MLNSNKIESLLLLNKEIDRGRLKFYNMLNQLSKATNLCTQISDIPNIFDIVCTRDELPYM